MKRRITIILMLFAMSVAAFATPVGQQEKRSKIEAFILELAQKELPQTTYSYFSFKMLGQIFKPFFDHVGKFSEISSSIKNIRNIETTGTEGYITMKKELSLFMQEQEEVMGLKVILYSRSDSLVSVIYGNDKNILVINDEVESSGEKKISLVFINGLSSMNFNILLEEGFDFNFKIE